MKTLLVPVDFSKFSEYALEAAANIAHKIGARIVVSHMIGLNDAIFTKDGTQLSEETLYFIKLTEKRFDEFLNKDYLKGVDIVRNVQKFKFFNDLDPVIAQFKVDLIVMGSHGSSGLSEMFVGSNTEKVVRSATVPVLVIKQPWKIKSIKKSVFACDFKKESIPAYLTIKEWCNLIGTKLELLYINLPDPNFRSTTEMEESVKKFFEAIPVTNPKKMAESIIYYNDYSVEEGIFSYANQNRIDLIAIPTHGRTGLAHFFSGSIGEDIANHSELPVLTVKI
ncbi:universal stress protein [Aegicerativicinus sediminis]